MLVGVKKRSDDSKLRYAKSKLGNKNPASKLTEDEVIRIKTLNKSGTNNIQMYKLFPHINPRTIRDVINNVCWKHIII